MNKSELDCFVVKYLTLQVVQSSLVQSGGGAVSTSAEWRWCSVYQCRVEVVQCLPVESGGGAVSTGAE